MGAEFEEGVGGDERDEPTKKNYFPPKGVKIDIVFFGNRLERRNFSAGEAIGSLNRQDGIILSRVFLMVGIITEICRRGGRREVAR